MKMTFFAMLQWPEILGILIVVLILFGAKKLPELARGLGQGIKEFKRATRDVQDDLQRAIDDVEHEPPPSPSHSSHSSHSSSPTEGPAPVETAGTSSEGDADIEAKRSAFHEGRD